MTTFLHKHIKSYYKISFILLITLNIINIYAHDDFSAAQKSVRIKVWLPDNLEDRQMLKGALEIDHYYIENGYLITELSEYNAKKLKSLPFKSEILCSDIAAELKLKNDAYYAAIRKNPNARTAYENSGDTLGNIIKTPADFQVKSTLGGYYSYAEMMAAINTLRSKYPNLVDTFTIGKTVEGRDIKCVKISDNPTIDEDEPEIGYMGLQHAREAIGGASMIFFMQYLCENYATDARIKNLVDNREFFIIPCMNADGWEYNRSTNPNGGGGWRKNRKNFGANYGVDLNRNWGVRWADCAGAMGASSCGSNSPSTETYWGPSAFSEPETQAVRAFAKTRNFAIFLDQHAFGPYYSIPPGRQPDALSSTDLKFYKELCANMGKYNGMKYGNSYEALAYEVAGGVKDWMLKGEIGVGTKGKVYGFTGEGGAGGGSGGTYSSFWPPAEKIVILCKGMVYQNLQMAYTAGSYVDHQDLGNINITTTSGNLPFRIRRLGLVNKPVTVSVIPLQNIKVGAAVTTSLSNFNDIYNDNITYTLPTGIPAKTVIKYVWKVETEACVYYDTIVKVYNGTSIIADDMETGAASVKWTITAGIAASPSWDYSTTYAFSGSKSLANAPTSKYGTAAVTRNADFKTQMDLSTVASAYLSFMVKHRAENFCDKMQVQISKDGSTWIPLSGKTTVKEPNNWDGSTINGDPALTGIHEEWAREIFDLKNYVGLKNLRLRFSFTSTNTDPDYLYNTDEGFFIDELSVIGGGNPSTMLPLELISFNGENDKAVNNLYWATATEKNTDRFQIERSVSGVNFETIGTVLAAGNSFKTQNYTFTDTKPYLGDNLYRLKMIDKDGTYTYSKLINIKINTASESILKPTGVEKLYPNPAQASLNIVFNETAQNTPNYSIKMYDITGEEKYDQKLQMDNGENKITINTSDLSTGIYIVAITNLDNNVIYEQKFIKQ